MRTTWGFLLCSLDDGGSEKQRKPSFAAVSRTSVDVRGRLRTSSDGSPGRIRTSDQSVNSRTLYH